MAWEARNGKGRYYTRSLWIDGHVVREYVGTGRKGEEAARKDATDRLERLRARQAAQEREREEEGRVAAVEDPLGELDARCDLLMRTALELAGYHKPQRWKWRKRRDREEVPEGRHAGEAC